MSWLRTSTGARAVILGLLFALWLAGHDAMAAEEGPLVVQANVAQGPYYVGQAIDLSVVVAAEKGRPEVAEPKIDWGVVLRLTTEDAVPSKNRWLTRFRLVAKRAGTLNIPPIVARLGGRKGTSGPLNVVVKRVPVAGRPAEFLGGVGELDVEPSAEPTRVRLGQTIDYRLTIRGPGATGLTGAPDLGRFTRLPIGIQVERLPDETIAEPPSHAYVYRLRPTRAGQTTLPPVMIAEFNPKVGRYLRKTTKAVPIQVAAVPRFDPSALDYQTPDTSTQRDPWKSVWIVVVAVIVAGIGLALRQHATTRDTSRRDVRRLCAGVLGRLAAATDDAARGRVITEGLIAYLGLLLGRPSGALTPIEAEEGVRGATGSDVLARDALRLIESCDRALFAGATLAGRRLESEGRRFFERLAEASRLEDAKTR